MKKVKYNRVPLIVTDHDDDDGMGAVGWGCLLTIIYATVLLVVLYFTFR